MARPTKLTPETQERIVRAIRAGNYADAACRAAGVGQTTFYRWMQRGEAEAEGPFREFRDAVRQAEAEAEVFAVATVRKAMTESWQAAIAFLERRHPDRWRRQQRTELTGRDGGPLRSEHALNLQKLTDEELSLLEEILSHASESE